MSVKRGVGVYLFLKNAVLRLGLACGQATLRGALAEEREREGELATTSLELNIFRKSRCEMLIGGDDISNDVSSIFHVFFNVFFTFALVSASRLLAES